MGQLKPRENRRTTRLRARMLDDNGWSDVTIANVSSRGLMLVCVEPLDRNSFIEVRHRNVHIVGRVVWAGGAKCGVRAQDVIDIADLLSQAPPRRERRKGEAERRAAPRITEPPRRAAAGEIAQRSRHFARAFDWALMVLAVGGASAFMAQSAWVALSKPLARVGTALGGGG